MTTYQFPLFDTFLKFVKERHAIYERRKKGQSAPWTKDPILRDYRFTNVYRELDRVTIWIRQHWREPYRDDPNLWFAMVVARLINRPETLAEFALPGRWNKAQFLSVMDAREARGERRFGSAYIVSTNGIAQDKAIYLADQVLDPLWQYRMLLRPRGGDTLQKFYGGLVQYQGLGSFMAAQVVADMKYVPPLTDAIDWWTFAASGPGSRRGMNYLMNYESRSPWREHEWRDALAELRDRMTPAITKARMPPMHAQDLQNCLCEFSKYRRTQLGTGTPKQKFTPNPEALYVATTK